MMKPKSTRACKRRRARNTDGLRRKEPQLAIGETILFGEFWASKTLGSGSYEHDATKEEKDEQSILQWACLKTHVPLSPEVQLAKQFINSLGRLHMQAAWCLLVPSYIGHAPEIDLAAQAVVAAINFQAQKDNSKNDAAARVAYGQALTCLRQKIDFSDSSLVAVGLLSLYEGVMRMHTSAQFSHRYGIAKIMLSRPHQPNGPTELDRALLFSDWDRRFRAPAALGTVSPFEDPYWLSAEPKKKHSPEQIVILRMLTNQLYIRLPRLILHVRRLRESTDTDMCSVSEATMALANELLELKDKDAESFLLHGVNIIPTKDQWDKPIVRYSFEYQTLQQMAFATSYWRARLLLMQLCLKMVTLPGNMEIELSQSEEDIKAETKRMITNAFMSYQYAQTLSMMGHITITQPFIVCFGVIACLDKWQDLPISSVQKWILLRINDTWGKWGRSLSSKDLEETNSVFSGGPLEGMLCKTYEDERRLYGPKSGFPKG